MGHGTHWEAVLDSLNADFGGALGLGTRTGRIIGRRRRPEWRGPSGLGEAEIVLIEAAESGFGILSVVVIESSRNYLHSAFPIAAHGQTHKVKVLSVHELSFGLEARITAALGEAGITFFEPYYALNAERYRPGAELDVVLAGVAYRLEIPDPNSTIVHPEIGEIHLRGSAVLLSMNKSDPRNSGAGGYGVAYMLEPSDEAEPDDYIFRGPAREIRAVDFLARPATRITATLLRIHEANIDVDIDLYVVDDKIRAGQRPGPGDNVAGALWLQGFAPLG